MRVDAMQCETTQLSPSSRKAIFSQRSASPENPQVHPPQGCLEGWVYNIEWFSLISAQNGQPSHQALLQIIRSQSLHLLGEDLVPTVEAFGWWSGPKKGTTWPPSCLRQDHTSSCVCSCNCQLCRAQHIPLKRPRHCDGHSPRPQTLD
jgi:hypothetical protein